MPTTHQQGIRVFASFDLVGSSALKVRMAADAPAAKQGHHWMKPLIDFFVDVPDSVNKYITHYFDEYGAVERTSLDIWRVTGDEVLFVSGRVESEDQILILARALAAALSDLDKKYKSRHDLGVKGTMWAAGFPIRNLEIKISPRSAPYVRVSNPYFREDGEDSHEPPTEFGAEHAWRHSMQEFQGPEIDLGFRLAALAQPGRLLASMEVAYFVAKVASTYGENAPEFHHVGWSRLKGLYGDLPYPIIWFHYGDLIKRVSFEEEMSAFCRTFLSGSALLDAKQVVRLEEDYLADTNKYRIRPYIKMNKTTPPGHYLMNTELSQTRSRGK